ncbi:hypothetical protein AX14_011519 [Amanita brunnescens Koide BX004]|nr:hypothetical protein AX14_011519 [Amanita brunnescens Koide BX004]
MGSINTRYLLTYEEAIVPYSLRLPTYRSSYIRRFHPYARFITPSIDDDEMVWVLLTLLSATLVLISVKGDENEDSIQLDLSVLAERRPASPVVLAEELAPENHVEHEIKGPRLGECLCNDNPAEVSGRLDIFPAMGQDMGEEPPLTLSVPGQPAPRPMPLVVVETRGELQNEGEEAHERVVENLEHENEQATPDGVPFFVVNPDRVHAELDNEDSIVEDLRRSGPFCRVVRTF